MVVGTFGGIGKLSELVFDMDDLLAQLVLGFIAHLDGDGFTSDHFFDVFSEAVAGGAFDAAMDLFEFRGGKANGDEAFG